ncbi:hypothetical protein SOVF_073180 [Spinacia oleracea]|nr:hypothetical protein SOVF_073180 [Spinacia oleracea]
MQNLRFKVPRGRRGCDGSSESSHDLIMFLCSIALPILNINLGFFVPLNFRIDLLEY